LINYYYININFPNISDTLKKFINQSYTLIVAGFSHHKSILNMVNNTKPIEIILYEGTIYSHSDHIEDKDNVTNYINENGFEKLNIGKCIVYHKEYIGVECTSLIDAAHEATNRFETYIMQ
jgi:hypothetical protein